MKPVIFLDVDGVLNHEQWLTELHGSFNQDFSAHLPGDLRRMAGEIDPANLLLLKELVESTDSQIVISSLWREYLSPVNFVRLFDVIGWKNAPIISSTPLIGSRSVEIDRWLLQYGELSYVIIDDTDFGFRPERFVHTNFKVGLTENDVKKAKGILKAEI